MERGSPAFSVSLCCFNFKKIALYTTVLCFCMQFVDYDLKEAIMENAEKVVDRAVKKNKGREL